MSFTFFLFFRQINGPLAPCQCGKSIMDDFSFTLKLKIPDILRASTNYMMDSPYRAGRPAERQKVKALKYRQLAIGAVLVRTLLFCTSKGGDMETDAVYDKLWALCNDYERIAGSRTALNSLLTAAFRRGASLDSIIAELKQSVRVIKPEIK
jgi:hypothetical protein